MQKTEAKVELVSCTCCADELAGKAAAICYDGKNPKRSLEIALGQHHESVIEHATFTFIITGVSRALLAQITRHRLASFSVESQRYVKMDDGFEYVIPPKIVALGEVYVKQYEWQMSQMHEMYEHWRNHGIAPEDARMVLPNACATKMMVTMNARELIHFLELRLCRRAQWEIRDVAQQMFRLAVKEAPQIFSNVGPACLRGACPEGKLSCGKPWKRNGTSDGGNAK